MFDLIKLEARKTKLNPYHWTAFFILLGTLGFLYLFAAIPMMESSEEAAMFGNYRALNVVVGVLEMSAFSILAGVMYSRLLIEEYAGKRLYLLFSYPVDRKRIFWAKLLLVTLCTTGAMIVGNVALYGIFYASELVFGIVSDSLSFRTLLDTFCSTAAFALLAAMIGMVSARIGFAKKSTRLTIIMPVAICCALSNVLTLAMAHGFVLPVATITAVAVGGIAVIEFAGKIANMEECA